MKKIFLFVIGIVLIVFAIPIIFTNRIQLENTEIAEVSVESEPENNYSSIKTIKLYHNSSDSYEEVELEEYIKGVVAAEMPASYEKEALKAQAIVARTYTIYNIQNNSDKHGEADICDSSSCCQAWISKEDRFNKWAVEEAETNWDKISQAVIETAGKIITYENEPINAFFHSNSGGKTEVPLNVWGGNGYPYLQTVETSGESNYSQYYSEVEYTKQEVIAKIKESYSEIVIDWNIEKPIEILEYTEAGRIRTIKFGNVNLSGVEARKVFGLKSANFEIEINGDIVKFSVIGYGHGVGLSQTGSDSLAKEGENCEDIIKHFYQGVEIIDY